MGVSVGLAALIVVVGLATLFLERGRDVESPHMPGPGNPESGLG